MTVGINDQSARSLAALIRTQHVEACKVHVGDIIVSDYAVWSVTGVDVDDAGNLHLLDQDGNAVHYPPGVQNKKVTIIDRSCRRK